LELTFNDEGTEKGNNALLLENSDQHQQEQEHQLNTNYLNKHRPKV